MISVIIPAYNAGTTLLETLDSVCQQTFTDLEILVVNDGSTDHTAALVTDYPDSRVRLINTSNGGSAHARNVGLAEVRGEFVSFLDADDLWTPEKLTDQWLALTHHPEAGVAYSWTVYFDEHTKSNDVPFFHEGHVYDRLLTANFIANGSNILMRTDLLKKSGLFNTQLKVCVDWDFYLRLAAITPFVLVPKHQILYRNTLGSVSANFEALEAEFEGIVNRASPTSALSLAFVRSANQLNLATVILGKFQTYAHWFKAMAHYARGVLDYPQILLDYPLSRRLPLRFAKTLVLKISSDIYQPIAS